jgi:hypothetical protein
MGERKREKWVVMRDTMIDRGRGYKKHLLSAFKFPRQWPLALLIGVKHLNGINVNVIFWSCMLRG